MRSIELYSYLLEAIERAFRKIGLGDVSVELSKPPALDMGDLALPCFKYSSILKKPPIEIAKEIGNEIEKLEFIEKIDIRGGFLNIYLDTVKVAQLVIKECLSTGKPGGDIYIKSPLKFVIEYSSPNSNKPLHLGHLRNNALGLSLTNILRYLGHKVIAVNLINDRGIHIAKTLVGYKLWGRDETPDSKKIKGDRFVGDLYVRFENEWRSEYKEWLQTESAKKEFDNWRKGKEISKNEEEVELWNMFIAQFEDLFFNLYSKYGKEAKDVLKRWEEGDNEIMELWKKIRDWVLRGFDITYKRMGIKFDKIDYESETYKLGREIIYEGLRKGLFRRVEDGAIVCDYEKLGIEELKDGYKVLIRSDGTSLYITQDIGTALKRYEELKFDKMIYVVGDEQIHHFKVLFSIVGLLRPELKDKCYHLSYGMVNLPEGRMKTREGKIVEADDLMDEVKELARDTILKQIEEGKAHREALTNEEIELRAELVAQAAIKFYLLSFTPKATVMFNPQKSLDLQGKTGPYCLYAYARSRSIMRKLGVKNIEFKEEVLEKLKSPKEKEIIRLLWEFPITVDRASKYYSPDKVAEGVYLLAKSFNQFFNDRENHPVIECNDKELQYARAQLVEAVSITLRQGLSLLGIETLEEM